MDDVKFCPTCGEPIEKMIELPRTDGSGTFQTRVKVSCRCVEKAQKEEADKSRRERFEAHMKGLAAKYGLSDGAYDDLTFSMDDRRDPALSNTCRRYVDRWEEMKENNIGIIFYGPPGTGKSFFAGAIVNALLEKQVPALMTNFPRLLNILQAAKDRQSYIDALQSYKLLVIDDLGVERDSDYAAEQVFSIIDARTRSKLPLIVTTNLTIEELKKPDTRKNARIYDRILELCPVNLKMTGESRRINSAEIRREIARGILLDG